MITHKSFSFSNIKFLLNIQTYTPDTKHIKQILVILSRISVRDQIRNINGKLKVFKII